MKNKKTDSVFVLFLIAVAFTCGCDPESQLGNKQSLKFSEQAHSMGWLGANGYPLLVPGTMDDPTNPDKTVTFGAMRIEGIDPNGAFGRAKLVEGDVVVGISDQWLPVKENPGLELFELIENQLNSGNVPISIGLLRGGEYLTVDMETDFKSLDENLPNASPRIIASVENALEYLASQQQDDGSFAVAKEDLDARLISTSLAGLAFLSGDKSLRARHEANVRQCLAFIQSKLTGDVPKGLQPIACAYVAQFLSESDAELLEENWLDVFSVLNDVFETTQLESGAWTYLPVLEGESAGPHSATIADTHVTNQVLLAIAALDRKGFSLEPKTMEAACALLDREGRVRIASGMDRRVKGALSAGTAAALLALNCDHGNPTFRRYLDNALERSRDMNTSPMVSLPGLFNCALVARHADTQSWIEFHNRTKYVAGSLFLPNGDVGVDAESQTELTEVEGVVDPGIWRATHWIMIRSMYWQPFKCLAGVRRSDEIDQRDHLGRKFDVRQQVGTTGDSKQDAEELTRMILQQLKDRGMEVDEKLLEKGGKSISGAGN